MRRTPLLLATICQLVALLALLPSAIKAEEPEPLRVAVLPMSSAMPDVPAAALEGALVEALVRSSHYSVVTRTQMDQVLAEQKLNNSDLVDPAQARSVGKLLGADYLVTGSLLSANFEPGFFSKDQFLARAQLQLVEAETGKVLFADTFLGKRVTLVMRRGGALSKLSPAERDKSIHESLDAIAAQFVVRADLLHPLSGYVVKVDGARVAISLGSRSGVKPGHEFLVVEEAEPIRDPVTGDVLSTDRKRLARLQVTSVEERLAWARIVATHSPAAKLVIGGERVDLHAPKGFLEERMTVVQTEPRASEIAPELERARRRRGR